MAGGIDHLDVGNEQPERALHRLAILAVDRRGVGAEAHNQRVTVVAVFHPDRVEWMLSGWGHRGERLDLTPDPSQIFTVFIGCFSSTIVRTGSASAG